MTVKQHLPLAYASAPDNLRLTDTMGSQDPEEFQRYRVVQECLDQHFIDRESKDEAADFLSSILLLLSGVRLPPILTDKDTSDKSKKEDSNDCILSRLIIDQFPLKSIEPFTSSLSPTLEVHSKTSTAEQGSPRGYLITPKEENLAKSVEGGAKELKWETRSTTSSSTLSPPPRVILTPDGWLTASVASVNTTFDRQLSPTMERLQKLDRFDDADYSNFNALVAVACVAEEESNDPNAQMTIEKLEAAGVLLELGDHDSDFSKLSHTLAAECELCATPNGKGHPITPAYTVTKDMILKKMENQYRRSGMKLVRALGARVTPSSTDQRDHLFWPNRKLFQDTQGPESPHASNKQITDYGTDDTLDDPVWKSDRCSDIPPDEKKKKPVQHQSRGPPAYLLDPNRTDPVAMAARNDHPGDLNDLPSILAGTKADMPYHASEPKPSHPTPTPCAKYEYTEFQGLPGSAERSTLLKRKIYHVGGGDGLWDEVEHSEENFTRPIDLEGLRTQRKVRDDNEMFEGLKAFQGNQRGWNGEHESDRQKTLAQYYADEQQRTREDVDKEIAEKEKLLQKGKGPATPAGQRAEPSYKGMRKDKVVAAKAKHLEEAYSERFAKVVQEGQDNDDFIEQLAAQNHKAIMKAPWDVDQIKRDALEAQKARFEEQQSVKAKEASRPKARAKFGLNSGSAQTEKELMGSVENDLKRKERHADGQIDAEQQKKLRTSEA